jgi:hypothetical protein
MTFNFIYKSTESIRSNHKWIITAIIVIAVIFLFINDIFIRPSMPFYGRYLRDLDHFIAAIIILSIIFTYMRDVKPLAFGYVIASLVWELVQYVQRGYFQWDQYLCDLVGTCVLVLLTEVSLRQNHHERN